MSSGQTEGLRRPPERRDGRRRGAGGARGLPLGRAPQALHHARHGDRPGPDRQRQRPRHHGGADRPHHRRDRHHQLPAALYAGRDRRVRRPPPRQGTSARPGSRRRMPGRKRQGAVFVETGPWLRAQYFPRAGERDWRETVDREVRDGARRRSASATCRRSARSTCRAPDAGAFLDRLYINTFSTLPVGRARYGVMLREDGFVLDDGTTSRLADDRFFMTTTTANAGARVPAHAVLPPGAVAGARRAVRLGDRPVGAVLGRGAARPRHARRRSSIRRSISATPPSRIMAVAELTVCGGIPARLYRISFSGELAYEIGVPARYGEALAARPDGSGRPLRHRALRHRGARRDADREGARGRQRARRPHHRARSRARPHDVDQEGLRRPRAGAAARRCSIRTGRASIGFKPVESATRGCAPARISCRAAPPLTAENDQGVITSVAFSPACGHWIGLGLLARGPERIGERVHRGRSACATAIVEVEVCAPCFVDPAGARMHG